MKKSAKTAEIQLLQLINKLSNESKFLNNDEFISVLNATKPICINKRLTAILVQSLEALKAKKINNQNTITQREKQVLLLIGNGLKNVDVIKASKNMWKS